MFKPGEQKQWYSRAMLLRSYRLALSGPLPPRARRVIAAHFKKLTGK